MGCEIKIDMSGQFNDCLWVCNVKMKKNLLGWKQGTFPSIFGFWAVASSILNLFDEISGGHQSNCCRHILAISTRSRWDTWVHTSSNVPLHVSGLILHGAFQTKFLGILYHKLSTFVLIRRSTGLFKCYFRIFEQLP